MAEKILNTRILLKYDTLENWNKASGYLRAGEVAIATVPEGGAAQEIGGVVPAPHQVLVKVGDGKHTFTELPFITARAGDVYAWAKAEKLSVAAFGADVQKLFTDINDDITALENKVGDSKVADQIAAAVKTAIEGLDVTDVEDTGKFVVAVPQVDGKVAPVRRALAATDIPELAQDKITGLTTRLDDIDDAIEAINDETTGILATANQQVNALATGAVATNTAAIAAINNPETGILKQAQNYADTKASDAVSTAANDATGKANKALEDAKDYVDDAIAAITGGETGSLKALEEKVNKNTAAIGTMPEAGEGEEAPTLVGMIAAAEKAADDAVKAEVKRAGDAEAELGARLDTVEAFWEAAQADGDGQQVIDTLKEIQEYIASDESGAAAMAASIKANADAIGEMPVGEDGKVNTTLVEMIAAAEGRVAQAVEDEADRADAAEKVNAQAAADAAAAAAVADGKAVAAQEAVNTLAGKVGTVAEGKTLVQMIEEAKTEASYDDTEVRGLITDEVARAEGAEKAINDKIGADALTGGHTTLIAAINAANAGVATNAGNIQTNANAIAAINNETTGILKQAKDYTDAEVKKVSDNLANLGNDVVKTVTGDDYITATKEGNNVALAFNVDVISCGTSAGLDATATV